VLFANSRVLDRHLPARERHETGARRHVAVVQRGALERLCSGGHAMRDPSSATSPGMRRLRVALCVMSLAVFAACGDDPETATGPATLKYVPADADAVVVVPTDLRGEQLKRLGALIAPSLREGPERSLRDVWRASSRAPRSDRASGLDRARQAAELQVSDV